MTAYIETSVLVANYCPESYSDAAQRAVRGAHPPTISMLSHVEFCSAISRKVRTGEMDAPSAAAVLSLFRAHLSSGVFRLLPVEAAEYARAADWIASFSTPLRSLDALHLAAAYSHGLVLITADKSLARAAEHFGVKNRCLS